MALEGLLFGSGREGCFQKDKAGQPIYSGTAGLYEEWKFRVMAKWDAMGGLKEEDKISKRKELASKVLDALKDDAMKIAMDLGREILIAEDGVPKLVDKMGAQVNTKSELEATELYKEGGKKKAPLSCQGGESMLSYVFRRRRWWTRLRTLGPKCNMSENILTDMLPDGSRLGKAERLMVLTSVSNKNE